ncbi:hypothetical protein NEHOM01_0561 [Nematocida homosporus]|uniref:uncharacterized protein n=1 Tax=Nematocida homosporus TaxID=1912981 RepID=UPI0022207A6A|nr:uncharacterized protein NEHOM01_0561 [Nematocida homosporus]KAI5185056.1 hypothetical protein NEHOM01_0561 [Nematocida homosporus]
MPELPIKELAALCEVVSYKTIEEKEAKEMAMAFAKRDPGLSEDNKLFIEAFIQSH